MNPDEVHPFDVRTNEQWRQLGATAENRPTITIDRSEVPEEFQHLIPHVERWAIGCDVIRGDYFDQQSEADIDGFYNAVSPHLGALNDWIDQSPQTDAKTHFMIMLSAHCEAACHRIGRERAKELEARLAANAARPPLTKQPDSDGYLRCLAASESSPSVIAWSGTASATVAVSVFSSRLTREHTSPSDETAGLPPERTLSP